ncbi:MAG: HNH endonuclease [Syntrophaceae bacterium]|nr:HNH endonuclease [Syntrophaceae bacterium]
MEQLRPTSKLDTMTKEERTALIGRLHKAQNGLCYVCQDVINLQVHKVDIDHIIALTNNGPDDESNWALTHESCNRSKGARELHLQRILFEFRRHVQKYTERNELSNERNFTLNEALLELCPSRVEVGASQKNGFIDLSWVENGQPKTERYALVVDTGKPVTTSFIGMIPFDCLHHNSDINPRSIVDLEPMIEEFYNGYPQLLPSLATININDSEGKARILIFDGQHKAAAQLYARRKRLFVRVFVNCDLERLKETNYRAHTKLAQVRFPQLINDKVGADLFKEEFERYIHKADLSKVSEDTFFSKQVPHVQRSEYRHYFGNYLRYDVLVGNVGTQQNMILEFTETVMPRSTRYPLSYDTLQKTMLDLMIYEKPAREMLDQTEHWRRIEKENLISLLNIFVEEVLAKGRFDLKLGVRRIEEKLTNDPQLIPDSHLRAYRICRKAAMMIWCKELKRAIQTMLSMKSRYKLAAWSEKRPLWAEFHEEDWEQIRKMCRAIRDHKIWGEKTSPDIVAAISSTRQKDWSDILLKGTLPGRKEPLLSPLDQNFMIQSATRQ